MLVTIGLVYIPTSIVVALFASVLRVLPVVRQLTDLAGNAAETSLIFALFAGGIANVLAFVAVSAMVAAYYDLLSEASEDERVRRVGARRRPQGVGSRTGTVRRLPAGAARGARCSR